LFILDLRLSTRGGGGSGVRLEALFCYVMEEEEPDSETLRIQETKIKKRTKVDGV
jgi:hypothetical protein